MSDNFILCPYCGKTILAGSKQCVHCGEHLSGSHKKHMDSGAQKFYLWNNLFGQITIALIVLVIIVFWGESITFNITHIFPEYESTNYVIDVKSEPIQKMLTESQKVKYENQKTSRVFVLQAQYSLSGIVTAKNTNFWLPGVNQSLFDEVVPIDLGMTWGKFADVNTLQKYFRFFSKKDILQGRRITWSYRRLPDAQQHASYINPHVSHNHVIPANDNIKAVLLNKVKVWDTIRLDGYLVDIVHPNGMISYTSLSRSDEDITSRGSGACEVFYVTGVQLGNKYYK